MNQRSGIGLFVGLLLSTQLLAQMPSGLFLHYPLNGDGKEVSGNGLDATTVGPVKPVQDVLGNDCRAVYLNGTNAFLRAPSSRLFRQIDEEITMAVWANVDPAFQDDMPWLTVVCKSDQPKETDNIPHFRLQLTAVTASLNSEFTENNKFDLEPGKWIFWAQTYDGSQVKVYKDGDLVFRFNYSGDLEDNRDPLEIGRDVPGEEEYFHGKLDDLMIFDRALDQSEIRKLRQLKYAEKPDPAFSFSCPGNLTKLTEPGLCGLIVDYVIPTMPPCVGGKVVQLEGLKPKSVFPVGDHEVALAYMEGGVPKQVCTFLVTVADQEKPVIQCPQNRTVQLKPGQSQIPVLFDDPQATDNCSVKYLAEDLGRSSGDLFAEGTHQLRFTAEDPSGNRSNCSFRITVQSPPAPQPSPKPKLAPEVVQETVEQPKPERTTVTPLVVEEASIVQNNPIQSLQGDSIEYQPDTIVLRESENTIYFYDDVREDGDIISVKLDQTWILQRQLLKKFRPELERNPHISVSMQPGGYYYLAVKAWNTGSDPPNTIAVDVRNKAGKSIHKFSLRSEPGQGAGAIFTYKP